MMAEKTKIEKLKEKKEYLKKKVFSGGSLGQIEQVAEELVDQAIESEEKINSLEARIVALEEAA